jgi:hypothetical protein
MGLEHVSGGRVQCVQTPALNKVINLQLPMEQNQIV